MSLRGLKVGGAMIKLTKSEVRQALARDAGIDKVLDADIARWFGITQAAVSLWGEEDSIPVSRVMQAMTKRPDLFGQIVGPASQPEAGTAGDDPKARAA